MTNNYKVMEICIVSGHYEQKYRSNIHNSWSVHRRKHSKEKTHHEFSPEFLVSIYFQICSNIFTHTTLIISVMPHRKIRNCYQFCSVKH